MLTRNTSFNEKTNQHINPSTNQPKSISVLSPILRVLVSPRIPVSLPIMEKSNTISNKLE
jgi:hypothetical protein